MGLSLDLTRLCYPLRGNGGRFPHWSPNSTPGGAAHSRSRAITASRRSRSAPSRQTSFPEPGAHMRRDGERARPAVASRPSGHGRERASDPAPSGRGRASRRAPGARPLGPRPGRSSRRRGHRALVGAGGLGRAGVRGRGRPRPHVLAGRAAEGAAGLLRHRRALQAHGHRPAHGQRRGRAARPVGPDQHREGRPDGGRPRARAVRLPPRLPRRRAPARLHLRAVGGRASRRPAFRRRPTRGW